MNKRRTHMTNRKNKLLTQKEFKGINLTSKEKELLEDRVNKIYEVLTQATNCFPRTFAFRVDLRFIPLNSICLSSLFLRFVM